MKKIILLAVAFVMATVMAGAQDMASATATFNSGAEALSMGNKADALKYFQEALQQGEALGEEAEELVANCKKTIPGVVLSIAKELSNNKDFAGALAKIEEAAKIAKEYGNDEVVEEAAELAPKVSLMKDMDSASKALAAKDFAGAVAGFKAVLAADPSNGGAAIKLLQAVVGSGDMAGAQEAFDLAVANGQEANAKKVYGGALLKDAQASLQAGKTADAIAKAQKAYEVGGNVQALYLAGMAAQKSNKVDDAIKFFEQYLEAAPSAKNAGQIALTVGALYQGKSNKAKAIEFYKKAQALGQNTQQYIDALSK